MPVTSWSASLWGCELKCFLCDHRYMSYRQPPCEAVSWNIVFGAISVILYCQPPCEAVSWNLVAYCIIPRDVPSASLWGCELKCKVRGHTYRTGIRQPPCEAVSWNEYTDHKANIVEVVSLLVRLWVEIHQVNCQGVMGSGQPPCEAVSWNNICTEHSTCICVSLFVRLWVEMCVALELPLLSPVSLLERLWVEIACISAGYLLVKLWIKCIKLFSFSKNDNNICQKHIDK